MIKSQLIEYGDGDTILEGYYAYDDSFTSNSPAIMVGHDWSGKSAFSCQKADALAELGYGGFAIDIYGKGKQAASMADKKSLMQPFIDDREKLLKRITAAFETVKKFD